MISSIKMNEVKLDNLVEEKTKIEFKLMIKTIEIRIQLTFVFIFFQLSFFILMHLPNIENNTKIISINTIITITIISTMLAYFEVKK